MGKTLQVFYDQCDLFCTYRTFLHITYFTYMAFVPYAIFYRGADERERTKKFLGQKGTHTRFLYVPVRQHPCTNFREHFFYNIVQFLEDSIWYNFVRFLRKIIEINVMKIRFFIIKN